MIKFSYYCTLSKNQSKIIPVNLPNSAELEQSFKVYNISKQYKT